MKTKKILYAEDDGMTAQMVIDTLNCYFPGIKIEHFPDGRKLTERLEKGASDFSVVVTDEDMPGNSGTEIIKSYAKKDGFEKIPFILFYGGYPQMGEKAIEEGARGYIRKTNIALGELKNVLEKILVQ